MTDDLMLFMLERIAANTHSDTEKTLRAAVARIKELKAHKLPDDQLTRGLTRIALNVTMVESEKRRTLTSAIERLNELQALSVTNIMIGIVPGDGSGCEVYAQSVKDVEDKMTAMACELEEWQLGIRKPAP